MTGPVRKAPPGVAARALLLLCALAAVIVLSSCGKTYEEIREERSAEAKSCDVVNVAVIWDRGVRENHLVDGVTMAADELNERGGFCGRKINLHVYYSKSDRDELALAKKVASDPSMAAVIGHRTSTNAIPASVIYEYCGLLFISPSSTNPNLTNHGFQLTFRTLPSDDDFSARIASFMRAQGHRKIAIIDDRTVYGKGIADGVMEGLGDNGLHTAVRRHFTPAKTDFKVLAAELLRYDFSAIFLGGSLPHCADFIRVARRMGVRQPFYGGDAMDSLSLYSIAGKAAHGTVVTASFDPELKDAKTAAFVGNFTRRYHRLPDTAAAVGYDSLMMLIEGMKRSGSAEPAVVASNLRFLKDWPGVTGSYTYNLKGDLVYKKIYFKSLRKDRFVFFNSSGAVRGGDDADGDKTFATATGRNFCGEE